MNLADTILRGRFRNGFEREEMMESNHVYRFEIALLPVANRFVAGHRIRLDVASSNFPRFDVNPGTGEKLGRHMFTRRTHNTLWTGSAYASHITLPVASRTPTC
jgi:putative CocE/NonD family hydrolase